MGTATQIKRIKTEQTGKVDRRVHLSRSKAAEPSLSDKERLQEHEVMGIALTRRNDLLIKAQSIYLMHTSGRHVHKRVLFQQGPSRVRTSKIEHLITSAFNRILHGDKLDQLLVRKAIVEGAVKVIVVETKLLDFGSSQSSTATGCCTELNFLVSASVFGTFQIVSCTSVSGDLPC